MCFFTSTLCLPLSLTKIGQLYDANDFEILDLLGEGFFSKVHKVKHPDSEELFVMKVSKPVDECRRKIHAIAAREVKIMRKLKHKNVLELKGTCISRRVDGGWDANLLVPFCEKGTLENSILNKELNFSWYRRIRYALNIASGIEYIHGHRIMHRDLTSANILIRMSNSSGEYECVVADFGLACSFPTEGKKLAQAGTAFFMSPECLNEDYYDEKTDVFSYGIIVCQMVTRSDVDPENGLPRTNKYGFDFMSFVDLCPPDTPIELLKLVFALCVMNSRSRPGFEKITRKLEKILENVKFVWATWKSEYEMKRVTNSCKLT